MSARRPLRVVCLAGGLLLLAAAAAAADASMPVRRSIVGCVTGGAFVSDDGYSIRLREAAAGGDLDLRRLEGRRLRVVGDLLPGDVLHLTRPPRAGGRCR